MFAGNERMWGGDFLCDRGEGGRESLPVMTRDLACSVCSLGVDIGWIALCLFLFQSRRDDPKPAQGGAT